MANLQEKYSHLLNIVVIYISEAHAKNEWPLSFENQTNQHECIEDRIDAASRISFKSLQLYFDSMSAENSNETFEERFAVWPERAFIIDKGVIKYLSFHALDDYDDWHSKVEEYVVKNM